MAETSPNQPPAQQSSPGFPTATPAAVSAGSIGSAPTTSETIPNNLFNESAPSTGGQDQAPPPEVLPPDAPVTREAHEATAQVVAQGFSMGCNLYADRPLTDIERLEFCEALVPVLQKHNSPAMPYGEEVRLAMVTGDIIVRRVQAKQMDDEIEQLDEAPKPPTATPTAMEDQVEGRTGGDVLGL